LSPEHHQRIQEAGVVAADFQSRSFLPERIFVLPQGEPCPNIVDACGLLSTNTFTEVVASREVFLGKGDLSKSPAAATGSVGLPDRLR
jgi:hypothetical protein